MWSKESCLILKFVVQNMCYCLIFFFSALTNCLLFFLALSYQFLFSTLTPPVVLKHHHQPGVQHLEESWLPFRNLHSEDTWLPFQNLHLEDTWMPFRNLHVEDSGGHVDVIAISELPLGDQVIAVLGLVSRVSDSILLM